MFVLDPRKDGVEARGAVWPPRRAPEGGIRGEKAWGGAAVLAAAAAAAGVVACIEASTRAGRVMASHPEIFSK